MKKLVLLALALGWGHAQAQPTCSGVALGSSAGCPLNVTGTLASGGISSYVPLGYQQITSLSAATTLTVPAGAKVAFVQPETAAVRWRDDGTDPTSSVGFPLGVGVQLQYSGTLSAISFIQQSSGAVINVVYYR